MKSECWVGSRFAHRPHQETSAAPNASVIGPRNDSQQAWPLSWLDEMKCNLIRSSLLKYFQGISSLFSCSPHTGGKKEKRNSAGLIRPSLEQWAQTHAEAVTHASLLPLWRSSVGWVELSDLKGNFYRTLLSSYAEYNGLTRWLGQSRSLQPTESTIHPGRKFWKTWTHYCKVISGHKWGISRNVVSEQIVSHKLLGLHTLQWNNRPDRCVTTAFTKDDLT